MQLVSIPAYTNNNVKQWNVIHQSTLKMTGKWSSSILAVSHTWCFNVIWILSNSNVSLDNDQCAACSLWKNDVTPEKYKQYVEAAISRIKAEIPRTVVQILGAFKVSQVYQLTRGQSYCHPLLNIDDALLNHIECSCFLGPDKNRKLMDSMVERKSWINNLTFQDILLTGYYM